MAKKTGFIHEPPKSENHEWYTPKWVFEILGAEFALDPCAPPGGLPWIPAKRFYSREDDGLSKPWKGRAWLNPPYGKMTAKWVDKMCAHGDGVALLPARTDTEWFHQAAASATALLFLKGRIDFVNAAGVTQHGFGTGSAFFAWGEFNVASILQFEYLHRGFVVRARNWPRLRK